MSMSKTPSARDLRQKTIARSFRVTLAAACAALVVAAPRQSALAAPQHSAPTACRYNGVALVPEVSPGHTYGWGLVVNFDHAPSATAVRTCLAERVIGQLPNQTRYTVGQQCAIVNNSANPPVRLGDGLAVFDGNLRLSCTLTVPATAPDLFWIKTRALLPNPSQSYTFLSGAGLSSGSSFTAQTDASCGLTLTSRYAQFQFNSTFPSGCGVMTEYGSRVAPASPTTQLGSHKVGATVSPQSTGNGNLVLPAGFSFDIGAAGQPFTLDWLIIDPTPAKCCSPN
jgi:hypothetical protein